MNDYIESDFTVAPCTSDITDVLASFLADVGYESFVPGETGLKAYIRKEIFDADAVDAIIDSVPFDVKISREDAVIEGRDWNSEWEKNYYQPVVIKDRCVVHSSFHKDFPQCEYDILIDPKMAFGTGHHSTTALISEQLLENEIAGKRVLDMGTGTGILAILASMRGAEKVVAVEIDPVAHENAGENFKINGCGDIELHLGDASVLENLPAESFDIVTANINRNVVVGDMESYFRMLKPGGEMYLSGFYCEDIPILEAEAARLGKRVVTNTSNKNWACVVLCNEQA